MLIIVFFLGLVLVIITISSEFLFYFTHILQGCFTTMGVFVGLSECINPKGSSATNNKTLQIDIVVIILGTHSIIKQINEMKMFLFTLEFHIP